MLGGSSEHLGWQGVNLRRLPIGRGADKFAPVFHPAAPAGPTSYHWSGGWGFPPRLRGLFRGFLRAPVFLFRIWPLPELCPNPPAPSNGVMPPARRDCVTRK